MKNGQPTQNPKERAEMIAKNLHLTLGEYASPPSNVESETIRVAKVQNISTKLQQEIHNDSADNIYTGTALR